MMDVGDRYRLVDDTLALMRATAYARAMGDFRILCVRLECAMSRVVSSSVHAASAVARSFESWHGEVDGE